MSACSLQSLQESPDFIVNKLHTLMRNHTISSWKSTEFRSRENSNVSSSLFSVTRCETMHGVNFAFQELFIEPLQAMIAQVVTDLKAKSVV